MEMNFERMRSCCFTGHRPVKLTASEKEIRQWLEKQIDKAILDGYVNFITGCAMGVDMWAGQIVLQRRESNSSVCLIAASPWPDMAERWSSFWHQQYRDLINRADDVVTMCDHYHLRAPSPDPVVRSTQLSCCCRLPEKSKPAVCFLSGELPV